ncbi:MAG TPA: stomatin-like protein [Longimicrobium sp.]|nr:stomatin-like protein [Longimicrobium sp.]
MGVLVLVMALVVLAVVLVAMGFTVVQQAETMVIERLGRYHRTLDSGINVIIPLVDQPRRIMWRYTTEVGGQLIHRREGARKIDLREQLYDFPRQNVITRDNVATEINAMLYFQITDPRRAVYEIADLPAAIEKLTQTSLRNVVGEMDLDELFSSRDKVNTALRQILDSASDKWGVKVNRVEIQDISPPAEIRHAMEKQMRAERDKRAAVLTAEASKQSAILEAEGMREAQIARATGEQKARIMNAEAEAQARVRVAQAEAEAVRLITESLGGQASNPASYLIGMRYIDALKTIGGGKGEKVVYLPYEATSLMASLGGLRELLAGPAAAQPPAARHAAPAPAIAAAPHQLRVPIAAPAEPEPAS